MSDLSELRGFCCVSVAFWSICTLTDVVANLLASLGWVGLGAGTGWFMLRSRERRNDSGVGYGHQLSYSSVLMLAVYGFLSVVLLHAPHLKIWPLAWRIQGIESAGWIMRSLLLNACGMAIALSLQTSQRPFWQTSWQTSWRDSRKQVMAIALIGVVGSGGVWGLERYLMAPIYPSLNHDAVASHYVVQQTSESSCAPAALVTVLKQWDIYVSEAEVAKLAQTSRLGTSMPHLIAAAQQLGMDGVDLKPSWQTMQQINRPGVLSVWVEDGDRRLPHVLALLKMSRDTAVVADPASGQTFRLKREQLEAMWRHEYVPIFRPTDGALSTQQALEYLTQTAETSDSHFNQTSGTQLAQSSWVMQKALLH